jgi:hypothetical protein
MFARFLYEFHDFSFDSLDLPPLPADQSDFDVHGVLKTHQVRTHLTMLCNPTLSYSYNLCSEYHYVLYFTKCVISSIFFHPPYFENVFFRTNCYSEISGIARPQSYRFAWLANLSYFD